MAAAVDEPIACGTARRRKVEIAAQAQLPGDFSIACSDVQSMIRKSVQRFSLATNAERVCAEIMLDQRAKVR
jgi:hypothetical protein